MTVTATWSTPRDWASAERVTAANMDTYISSDLLYLYTYGGGAGTSFPASPVTGQRWLRTDRQTQYYWDGTRWLSETEYSATILVATAAVSATNTAALIPAELRSDYAPYITRCVVSASVATTNNGSNYWTIAFRGVIEAGGTFDTLVSYTTASVAAGVLDQQDGAPTTAAPTNRTRLDVLLTKTGTPGNITCPSATVYYRLIG